MGHHEVALLVIDAGMAINLIVLVDSAAGGY